MIIGLPTNYVGTYWHQLVPLISKALKKLKMTDLYSLEDIKKNINDKIWQCWVYVPEEDKISCVFITQLIQYPAGKKVMNIILAGGAGLKEWKNEVWDFFIERAREKECQEIIFSGRSGWERLYPFDVKKQYSVKL